MLSQLHRDRITKLRDTLLQVPASRFNMNTWGHRDRRIAIEGMRPETVKLEDLECGFAGCVYGHFPTAFWDEGWRWIKMGLPLPPGVLAIDVLDTEPVEVMADFLGLTVEQAAYVALPEAYYGELESAEYVAGWVKLITPEVAAGHLTEILRCDAEGVGLPEFTDGDADEDD